MRKHLLLMVAALTLTASGVWAADSAPKADNSTAGSTATSGKDKDWTLDEARKHAHERAESEQKYADKLDKMTESEWAEHEKRRDAFKEKYAKMTPEEKKAYWQKRKENHEEKMSSENSSSSDKNESSADKK